MQETQAVRQGSGLVREGEQPQALAFDRRCHRPGGVLRRGPGGGGTQLDGPGGAHLTGLDLPAVHRGSGGLPDADDLQGCGLLDAGGSPDEGTGTGTGDIRDRQPRRTGELTVHQGGAGAAGQQIVGVGFPARDESGQGGADDLTG